jgi:iron complex outermembrane recepter protein
MQIREFGLALLLSLWILCGLVSGQAMGLSDEDVNDIDLTKLSIDELMRIEVTSVSRQEQAMATTPAAIYVITEQEIKHSGATCLPELLRAVPGLHVARISANEWVVAARGFSSRYANKMLVLIDGRSIYSPLYSGVNWDTHDLLFSNIERIEIIRGPGATMWGANAVNGVINVITRSAADMEGLQLSGRLGTVQRSGGSIRYGGKVLNLGFYSAYLKYSEFNSLLTENNGSRDPDSGWEIGGLGLQLELNIGERDSVIIQAHGYSGGTDRPNRTAIYIPPYSLIVHEHSDYRGGDFRLRWSREHSGESAQMVQCFFLNWQVNKPSLGENVNIIDIDYQHNFNSWGDHNLIWGVGYRYSADEVTKGPNVQFTPNSHEDHMFSAFLQHGMELSRNIDLTVGTKFEGNSHTNFEYQPSVRIAWSPSTKQAIWASCSRAVRSPSRTDHRLDLTAAIFPVEPFTPGGPEIAEIRVKGNHAVKSEEMLAYEAGYRMILGESLSLDLAGFYNIYDNLVSFETVQPVVIATPVPHYQIALVTDNLMFGSTLGLEIAANLQLGHCWRLTGLYSHLAMDLRVRETSNYESSDEIEGRSPQDILSLRSQLDPHPGIRLTATVNYVDDLPGLELDGYAQVDTHFSWSTPFNCTISAGSFNLLNSQHREYSESNDGNVFEWWLGRRVYGKVVFER